MKKLFFTFVSILSLVLLSACQNISTHPSGISIELPNKLEYNLNEDFDPAGLIVYSHQQNGDTKTLSPEDYEIKNSTLNKLGIHEIEVKFKDKSAYFSVLVKEDPNTIKFAYISNFVNTVFYSVKPNESELDLTGLEITYILPNFKTEKADLSDFGAQIFDLQLSDSNYNVYVVNMTHKEISTVTVTFFIYVAK